MKSATLLLLLFFVIKTGCGQRLAIGDKLTDLGIEKYLQNGDDNEEDLKGKALVLEFWATWCAPCLAQVPHLNELAERFEDENVQFISVTAEKEETIREFFQRRAFKMSGWIGLDTDRSLFQSFQIDYIPRTVLVYPNGKIAMVTRANYLNEMVLENLVANRPLEIESFTKNENAEVSINESTPFLKVHIGDGFKRSGLSVFSTDNVITAKGTPTLGELLSNAYPMRESRMLAPDSLLEKLYEVDIETSTVDYEGYQDFLQTILEIALPLEIKTETQTRGVLVLKSMKKGRLKLGEDTSGTTKISNAPGVLVAQNVKLSVLIWQLENVLEKIVVDETQLDGVYKWQVTFDAENPESVIQAVEEQLGLQMEKAEREVQILVVKRKE